MQGLGVPGEDLILFLAMVGPQCPAAAVWLVAGRKGSRGLEGWGLCGHCRWGLFARGPVVEGD